MIKLMRPALKHAFVRCVALLVLPWPLFLALPGLCWLLLAPPGFLVAPPGSSGCWVLLASGALVVAPLGPGSSWFLLAPSSSFPPGSASWLLPAPPSPGSSWLLLALAGSSGLLLRPAPPGSSCVPLVLAPALAGSSWLLLALPRWSWLLLALPAGSAGSWLFRLFFLAPPGSLVALLVSSGLLLARPGFPWLLPGAPCPLVTLGGPLLSCTCPLVTLGSCLCGTGSVAPSDLVGVPRLWFRGVSPSIAPLGDDPLRLCCG